MAPPSLSPRRPDHPLIALAVLAAAAFVAVFSARPHAGGWNDGSRLATVESLVDYHTLAIDRSVFVKVPSSEGGRPLPYSPNDAGLNRDGTQDKLFVDGRYYSDKSPVPALLLAGLYQVTQSCLGLVARDRLDVFTPEMTLASSGLAYLVAVWCIYRAGGLLKLPTAQRLALTGSFGFGTVALTYSRHVNNHILLLGITAALLLGFLRFAAERPSGRAAYLRIAVLGSLAGLGYTTDLGAGPVLLACALGLVVFRCRRAGPALCFCLAALPWLALHHAVNYSVGGTFKPANAVGQYLQWPGSPFSAQNMTGAFNHSAGHFLSYSAQLLVGKRGFLGHNLPLFLAVPGCLLLLRRRPAELPELLFACVFSGGAGLVYALTSNNYSGLCCSIRWFVPFLAPGYFVLALLLRDHPRYWGDFLLLSGWGAVLSAIMWWHGPWIKHMVPLFWPLQAAALLSWLAYRIVERRNAQRARRPVQVPAPTARAA